MKHRLMIFIFLGINLIQGLRAQSYEITHVDPHYLYNGTNVLTIVLNENLDPLDSVFVEIRVTEDGVWAGYHFPSSISFQDSVITSTFEIPELTVEQQGKLTVSILDTTTWDSFYLEYEDTLIIANIWRPALCEVTTDSSGNNWIFWEDMDTETQDSVFIYRSIGLSDEYDTIACVASDNANFYIDSTSRELESFCRYTIAAMDTHGILSLQSIPHKNIYLSHFENSNNSVTLLWDSYEGFTYPVFEIYRGFSLNEMYKIAEISSNIFSYTDPLPPTGTNLYQIRVSNPSPCTAESLLPPDIDLNSIHSNTISFTVTALDNAVSMQQPNELVIYPNPSEGLITVRSGSQATAVFPYELYDALGVRLKTGEICGGQLEIGQYRPGIYFLRIRTDSGESLHKLILEP